MLAVKKKTVLTAAFISTLIFSTQVGVQFVELSKANFVPLQVPLPAIFIKSDGSVDPLTAPIQQDGDSYIFTANISGYTLAVQS